MRQALSSLDSLITCDCNLMMASGDGSTREMLNRWNGGEQEALGELLAHHLDWITDYVHGRIGGQLRGRAETMDFVQASMVDFLKHGPRFEIPDESAFRALLARVAENNIRDHHRHFNRKKRDIKRTEPLGSNSVLGANKGVTRPSQHAQRDESIAMVRVALELLDPQDRQIVLLREFEELSFAEVGKRMDVSEGAARMRFGRALPRLAEKIAQLREGGLAGALRDLAGDDSGAADGGAADDPSPQ